MRYPVELPPTFVVGKGPSEQAASGGLDVEIERTSYGAMLVVGEFSTRELAQAFADRLNVELRLLSIRKKIGLFTPEEIHDPQPLPGWIAADGFGGWRSDHPYGVLLDGQVFNTLACIVPQHRRLMFAGDARIEHFVLPIEELLFAAAEAAIDREVVEISERLRNALDFFSLACAHLSPMVSIVNLATTLEILADIDNIHDRKNPGRSVRDLLRRYSLDIEIFAAGAGMDPIFLSNALYRVRSHVVHHGKNGGLDLFSVLDSGRNACAAILESKLSASRTFG